MLKKFLSFLKREKPQPAVEQEPVAALKKTPKNPRSKKNVSNMTNVKSPKSPKNPKNG